jgi:hypothetical protein
MKIRSITYFLNPGWPINQAALDQSGLFIQAAQPAYEQAGYEVQTVRLATVPFPTLITNTGEAIELAQALEPAAMEMGFGYLSLGPALPEHPESYAVIPEMIAATENTFFGGVMASEEGVSLSAIQACAQVIHQAATLDPNGFSNLNFAAMANIPPGSPFFPAGYHGGGRSRFAVATEAADLAVTAFSEASSLNEGVQMLIKSLETHGRKLAQVGEQLAEQFEVPFSGIDFSLAPFPEEALSIGTAFERMGVPRVGQHGSLAAAAILTDALDNADFPRAGFSGLMLPVLEDATLAKRAAEDKLCVKDLLMYSAVCGTGLDTVPVPGDTSVEQIAALLLDVAALSQRLGKPLTARLMPVPGKKAGDKTEFDFPFFANSRILEIEAEPLEGYLAGEENFSFQPRS